MIFFLEIVINMNNRVGILVIVNMIGYLGVIGVFFFFNNKFDYYFGKLLVMGLVFIVICMIILFFFYLDW